MKIRNFVLAAALCALAIPAVAEDSNYNRVSVGYNANLFSGDYSKAYNKDGKKGATFNGFNVQYVHGWKIIERPLFIETGLKLATGFNNMEYKIEGYKSTVDFTKMTISVPVNISYRFACGENFSIQPYTGVHFAFNAIGKCKYEVTDDDGKESSDFSLFDKKKVDKDEKWDRFQMGWQIGCGVNIKKFYVGVEYSLDFMKLAKKLNTSDVAVSVGYNF